MAQSEGRKRPHSAADTAAGRDVSASLATPAGGPDPTAPWVKSRPAHCFLNTPPAGPPPTAPPPAGPPPAASGNSALARLYQVVCGTIASIRWS